MRKDYWGLVRRVVTDELVTRGAISHIGVIRLTNAEIHLIRFWVWLGCDAFAERVIVRALNRRHNDHTH